MFFNSAENFTQRILPCFPLKWSWQPCCLVIFFVSWMCRQQERHVHMKRAGEGRSASLGSSLQSSFQPLSQAEWLTLDTRPALLTRLHTDHCCFPEQIIDELLRLMNNNTSVETPEVIWNFKLRKKDGAKRGQQLFWFLFFFSFTYYRWSRQLLKPTAVNINGWFD